MSVFASRDASSLSTTSGCTCPMTYECTVVGRGATVWKGSIFDCMSSNNEIILLHDRFSSTVGTKGTCNNEAIVGKSVGVEDNHYTSQLNITAVKAGMIGKTVECIHDLYNGTEDTTSYAS